MAQMLLLAGGVEGSGASEGRRGPEGNGDSKRLAQSRRQALLRQGKVEATLTEPILREQP